MRQRNLIGSLTGKIQFLMQQNWLGTCAGFIFKTWFGGLPPDRACIFSTPYKGNWFCAFVGNFRKEFLIYQVTCTLRDAIYKGNTQQIFKKRIDGHLLNVQKLLKKWSKIIFLCGPLLKPFWIYHITRWPTYAHAWLSK